MIALSNSVRKHRIGSAALVRAAQRLLAAAGVPQAGLSIALVGDRAIRRLNRNHRGKDRATDVLSFGGSEHPDVWLGDVVISLDRAARQAAAYDATLEAEVRRLLVHGVAHLRGYDHEAEPDRARMLRFEQKLARAIGLPWPY